MSFPQISIIVPCYNEAPLIYDTLCAIVSHMGKHHPNYEIIVVDDGSTDNSKEEILRFIGRKKNVRLYEHKLNQGKGSAILTGLCHAEGELILTMDADLSTSIEELEKLLPHIAKYDFVVGSRYLPDLKIIRRQSPLRILYSRAFNILVRLMFQIDVKDSQNGFKLYTRRARNLIIDYSRIHRFAYDVEHFVILDIYYMCWKEVGVTWEDRKPQRVRLSQIANMMKDLLKIRHFINLRMYK
jgi:glycosyltransferase involved in cell wall biosynthesis